MGPLLLTICSATALLFVNTGMTAQVKTVNKCKKNVCANCEPAPFFAQGMPLKDSQDGIYQSIPTPVEGRYAPGYSAAACPRVDSAWDLNVSTSFIYWHFSQEAMDIAYVAPTSETAGQVIQAQFGYKPGFKLGFGVDTHFDNWALNAEYTWFHPANESSSTTSSTGFAVSDWFQPASTNLYRMVSSLWGTHLDQIDLALSRPYYEGAKIVIAPNGGLRALWLHQGCNVTMTNPTVKTSPILSTTSYSHSWAIGPKFGVNSKWMFWKGARLDGTFGSSLLFTRYTELTNSQTTMGLAGITEETSAQSGLNALRPTLDMGLGLGYGAYFFNNKFFFDVSARYDFAEYWSQNMMRTFASQLSGRNNEIGDLNLHGLTINVRCDF